MSDYMLMRYKNNAVALVRRGNGPATDVAEEQRAAHPEPAEIWLYDVEDKQWYRREAHGSRGTWRDKPADKVPQLLKDYVALVA